MIRIIRGYGWCYLLLLLFTVSLIFPCCTVSANSSDGKGFVLYIFGDPTCHACVILKSFLDKESIPYKFCPLSNSSCLSRYYVLVRNYGIPQYIPVTLVISNDSVKAVVIGAVRNTTFWYVLSCMDPGSSVPVYDMEKVMSRIDVPPEKLLKMLAPEFTSKSSKGGGREVAPPLPVTLTALVGLALSDAVNPCATYIYVVLLTSVAVAEAGRRRRVIAAAFAFIAAVFAGYYMLGLGIMNVFKLVPTSVLGLVAAAYGGFVIFRALRERSRCVGPGGRVSAILDKAKVSVLFSAILGFVVTFTLLPCSSGPYLVFAGIVSRYPLGLSLALLALYNLVFVAPLAVLAILIAESMKYEGVRDFMIKYRTHLSIIAGAALICLGIYVLVTSL